MPHTILIADDSPFIREALCNVFEREEDFDVCGEAENGREAVEKAQELHPDLILLDLSMPVMNGLDATRVLKQMMPEVPVIMLCSARTEVLPPRKKPAPRARVRSSQSLSTFLSCLARRALCSNPDNYTRSGHSPPAGVGGKKVCCLHFRQTGGHAMMHDFELARGDISLRARFLRCH
jgi:CheY-like chemotaxis protein